MADKPIPKAADLYRGDINEAVIKVQKLTGIEITPQWWDRNVSNQGSTQEILARFDRAYAKELEDRKTP